MFQFFEGSSTCCLLFTFMALEISHALRQTALTLLQGQLLCHVAQSDLTNQLSSVSLEQAENSSKELRVLVLKSLDNDEKMARRLDTMQRQESAPWLSHSRGGASSFYDKGQERMSRTSLVIEKSERTLFETPVFGFAFDEDLRATRVYQRLALVNSWYSLPSSKGQSRAWSYLSDVSLSQVSNISVLSLPLYAAELYDGGHYIVDTTPERDEAGEAEQYQHPWLSIFRNVGCHEAQVGWPSGRIAEWMKSASSDDTLIGNFMTDEQSGYAILYLNRGDMATYAAGSSQQEALWRVIQRLQCAILDEVLQHRREGDQTNFFSSRRTEPTLPLSVGSSKNLLASGMTEINGISSEKVENPIAPANPLRSDEDDTSAFNFSSDKNLPCLPREATSPPSNPSSDSGYESMFTSLEEKQWDGPPDDLKHTIMNAIWQGSREVSHTGFGSIASPSYDQDRAITFD